MNTSAWSPLDPHIEAEPDGPRIVVYLNHDVTALLAS
jgi:hypothetical protein